MRFFALVVIFAACVLLPSGAAAVTHELRAAPTTLVLPDGTSVPMWGFGFTSATDVSVPGPVLEVPPGDTTLDIVLTNDLGVPISFVVPGQGSPNTPVWDDGSVGPRPSATARVVSFTAQVQPGSTVTYSFTNLQPGTFLYESGTHPAVQVQMGLYGALRVLPAAGEVYAGVGYDAEAVLLYSEVDPGLHQAVQNGTYGTGDYQSPIDYAPDHFLINGQPYPNAAPVMPLGTTGFQVGQRVLLRLLNAGLESHVPVVENASLAVVAENGSPYPYLRRQEAVLLPAGGTVDVLVTPLRAGSYPVWDRRLHLANAGSPGGMLTYLQVAAGDASLTAMPDAYTLSEDQTLDTLTAGLDGVLANDLGTDLTAELVTDVGAGSLTLASDGSFTYTPSPDFNGADAFTYAAVGAGGSSAPALVQLTIDPVNDAPIAEADALFGYIDEVLVVPAPGVLGNDHDVDGDALSAVLVESPTSGTLTLGPDGSVEYTPATGTVADAFTYRASDGVLESPSVQVTLTLTPRVNEAPVAVNDLATTPRNTSVLMDLVANDHDADGSIAPGSLVIVTPPNRGGSLVNHHDGTVTFTPKRNTRGTDQFTYQVADDQGALSNVATATVNIVK